MITVSRRKKYVACHVTAECKVALRKEADRRTVPGERKTSVSAVVADYVTRGLSADGYNLEEPER